LPNIVPKANKIVKSSMGFQDFGGGINKLQYFGVNLEYLLILFAVSTS
jgi:hypothetical protein